MNLTRYFILIFTLSTLTSFASNNENCTRYKELKRLYRNEIITPQEKQELAQIAAGRRIAEFILNPNENPLNIAPKLSKILGHPLFDLIDTVQVGSTTYYKCILTAYPGSPALKRWIPVYPRRRAREEDTTTTNDK